MLGRLSGSGIVICRVGLIVSELAQNQNRSGDLAVVSKVCCSSTRGSYSSRCLDAVLLPAQT